MWHHNNDHHCGQVAGCPSFPTEGSAQVLLQLLTQCGGSGFQTRAHLPCLSGSGLCPFLPATCREAQETKLHSLPLKSHAGRWCPVTLQWPGHSGSVLDDFYSKAMFCVLVFPPLKVYKLCLFSIRLKLRIQVVSQHARHFSKYNPNWFCHFKAMEQAGEGKGGILKVVLDF